MKTWKWIIFTIYGIIITGVFLYCCFPSENIRNYIESVVPANNQYITLSLDSAKPSFPPGITLGNLVISFRDKPGSNLKADILTARPALGSLVLGHLSLLLKANAYEGNMRANVSFANRFSARGPIKANVRLDNINIGNCSYLTAILGRQLDGKIKGLLTYEGKYEEISGGTGKAELIILNGSIRLARNAFGFDKLIYDRIETDMVLRKRILKMNKINLLGKQLRGTFNGNIFLDNDIEQSRLAIRGNVYIPALKRKFSAVLSGTIANPTMRFK